MLFKIPKTGEIDSSEQSMTGLVLKSAYNLVAIFNICYIFVVVFEMFLNTTIYKIKYLPETLNTPSYILQIIIFILCFSSLLYAINKMFDEKYIPTRKEIYLFLISFTINSLSMFNFLATK